MERKILLKSIIVIGLSLILVLSFTNLVFADDDFDWDSATVVGGNEATGTNNLGNNTSGITPQNLLGNTAGNTTGNQLNPVTNNTTNKTTNNVANKTSNTVSKNSLAYTGSDNNGVIAIIVVAGAIVTIYSYARIKEYKNM